MPLFFQKTVLVFSLMVCTVVVFSQKPEEHCATQSVLDFYKSRDANVTERLEALEKFTQNFVEKNAVALASRTVVTIPVVVHVVYRFSSENISDAQILSQFDVLNADYRMKNSNASQTPTIFKSLAADVEFEFCLAKTDPDGKATTGITRTQTNISQVGAAQAASGEYVIKHSTLGGHDAWDESKYLNIWIGKLYSGLLGFSTFPGVAPIGEDGVVIDPFYFGTTGLAASSAPNNLGRTATHEIGHYFNLHHIWGDANNSCTDDDFVNDTPTQKSPFYGCPTHPQISCGNTAMFQNFMDYTDDGCMMLFTADQKLRMQAALNGPRASLLTSNGCQTIGTQTIENEEVSLWPNPADEFVFVKTNSLAKAGFDVWNALGQPVFCIQKQTTDGWQIDVSALPAGVYLIRNSNWVKKFLKN